jgi:hypothetical protein
MEWWWAGEEVKASGEEAAMGESGNSLLLMLYCDMI